MAKLKFKKGDKKGGEKPVALNITKKKKAEKPEVKAKPGTAKTTAQIREECKPLQNHVLGGELEIWEVDIALLQEQSVNARAMTADTFLQLVDNIKRGNRLESLPFCALTNNGLEIISGHHRVRAARKAELTTMWVLVDVSMLPRDYIRSKQLSHNSIQGQDDMEIVNQIFGSIEDVDARIEAYISAESGVKDIQVKLDSMDLEIDLETKTVHLMFLPLQKKVFTKAIKALEEVEYKKGEDVYLAAREEYELMVAALGLAGEAYNITSVPTLFARISEIIIEHAEKEIANTKAAKKAT